MWPPAKSALQEQICILHTQPHLHELCQRGGRVGGYLGAQALLHHPHGCLQGGHLAVGYPPREQLPQHDAKGEDVCLLLVGRVLDDLWGHPPAASQGPVGIPAFASCFEH